MTTDFYFLNKNKETEMFKKAILLNNFLFAKIDFFLIDAKTKYEICISKDGELFAIYSKDKKQYNCEKEFTSEFRKKYLDNKIDEKKINNFIKKYQIK